MIPGNYRIHEHDSIIPIMIFFIITIIFIFYYIKKGKLQVRGMITSTLFLGIIFGGIIYSLFYLSRIFGEKSLIYTFPIFIFILCGIGYYIYQEKEKNK